MAGDRRKTALITGCSSGIGRSLALQFAARGLHVLATARRAASLDDLVAEGRGRITALDLTVDDADSVAALKARVLVLTGGRLDYLVNNAGRNYTVPATDVDFDEVRATFETNLFGVMRMVQSFVPLLIEARGCIVQIGSLAGIVPYVFGSTYNASKAALHAYSNTLRVELEPFGVSVVTIITGGVKSDIARTKRELPPDSLYITINDEFQRRVTHSQDGAMSNEAFAASVASKVLSSRRRMFVWEGNRSWIVWFVSNFLPKRTLDRAMWRMFKLWKLVKPNSKTV